MSDPATVGTTAAVLLVIFLLGWFALGRQGNIRKGNRLVRWLQDGLPVLGHRTTFRWLGSAAVELTLEDAKEPFRAAQVVVSLEPRDVVVFWGYGRLRGRRDFLILRGHLRRGPLPYELEAGDRRGWTGRDGLKRLDATGWTHTSWGDSDVEVAYSGGVDHLAVRRHWEHLAAASGGVWRLSIRRDPARVEVHVLFPDTAAASSQALIRAFRDLVLATYDRGSDGGIVRDCAIGFVPCEGAKTSRATVFHSTAEFSRAEAWKVRKIIAIAFNIEPWASTAEAMRPMTISIRPPVPPPRAGPRQEESSRFSGRRPASIRGRRPVASAVCSG